MGVWREVRGSRSEEDPDVTPVPTVNVMIMYYKHILVWKWEKSRFWSSVVAIAF